VKKEERNYTMYLQDLLVAMTRIADYIDGYTFNQFKKDYKTVDAVIRDYEIIWDVCVNHLPENRLQIQSIIDSL